MFIDAVTLSKYRKVVMAFIKVIRMFLCSDCRKVVKDVYDMIGRSEDLEKNDKG